MLREYTSQGVQVVSPLTLGQKLELVKAGVHAQRLSEEALAVQERLQRLGQRFDEFADDWDTCVRHLSNAKDRADDADAAFERLRSEFDRIDSLSLDGGDDATVREPLSRGREGLGTVVAAGRVPRTGSAATHPDRLSIRLRARRCPRPVSASGLVLVSVSGPDAESADPGLERPVGSATDVDGAVAEPLDGVDGPVVPHRLLDDEHAQVPVGLV